MNNNKGIKYLIEELYKNKWNDNSVTFHEILRRMYIDEDKSMRDIASEFRIGVGSIYKFLKEEGIQKEIRWK